MSGSLSAHPKFVADAFAQAATLVYDPEEIRLGVYSFLPWVRTGLSSIVQDPASGEMRATVTVGVDVEDDGGGKTPVQKTLKLRGPGDVLGLQPGQIVRRYPAPNTPDAQDTFLAYVEFDRPELPWLFTPFAPSGPNQERLAPWLALVVLEARFASFEPAPAAVPPRPPRVWTRKGELQPLTNSWAFAHAQVVGDTDDVPGVSVRADGDKGVGDDTATPSVRDRLTDEYAPVNLSRLLCPRRLDDGVNYVACIVPAFDCGVKAAMGVPGGTLDPAWVRSAGDEDQEIVLPVYDHWRFSTAKGGDFEELARRLVPVKAPWKVGRRFIDTHHPRGGMSDLEPDAEGRLQVLKCALFSPLSAAPGSPSEDSAWSMAKREELKAELDRADATALSSTYENVDLPRVGTRLYARFQRGSGRVATISDGDWFSQLNTTPAHRIVAGLGTRVVQKDQEQLMQSAWAQVGEIDKANQVLVRAQYARYIGGSLHKRHLSRLTLSSLVQVTRTVQGKIKLEGSAFSIRGDLENSFVAPAAADWPFRRAVRPRGAVARLMTEAPGALLDRMVAPEGKFRDFRRTLVEPDGVAGLRPETLNALPKDIVARVLGVSETQAIATLRARLEPLATTLSTADRLLQPVENWTVRPGSIDIGKLGGTRVLDVLVDVMRSATPTDRLRETARNEAVGALLHGIAESGVDGIDRTARELLEQTGRWRPQPITRTPTTFGGRPLVDRTPRFESEDTVATRMKLGAVREVTTYKLASTLSQALLEPGVLALPLAPERKAPGISHTVLMAELEPSRTVTRYARGRLKAHPSWLAGDWFLDGFVQPIMAAPEFKRPMYEALDAYNRDWLVPGLGLFERTDFVTLLETNAVFTEAFLVGLSDEMGRELLWREYPTDQRGTYFKYFWDDDEDELTAPIHRFSKQPLGQHIPGGASGRVVFVVRGELVKRYPDATMMALRRIGTNDGLPVFGDPEQHGASVIFHANLAPDILLVGFDLEVQQVKDEKWWFFIAEHPTAPRFGLDVEERMEEGAADSTGGSVVYSGSMLRNDLAWSDIGRVQGRFIQPAAGSILVINERTADPPPQFVTWPPDSSAVLARVFLQNPIRAAYEGAKLLEDIEDEG